MCLELKARLSPATSAGTALLSVFLTSLRGLIANKTASSGVVYGESAACIGSAKTETEKAAEVKPVEEIKAEPEVAEKAPAAEVESVKAQTEEVITTEKPAEPVRVVPAKAPEQKKPEPAKAKPQKPEFRPAPAKEADREKSDISKQRLAAQNAAQSMLISKPKKPTMKPVIKTYIPPVEEPRGPRSFRDRGNKPNASRPDKNSAGDILRRVSALENITNVPSPGQNPLKDKELIEQRYNQYVPKLQEHKLFTSNNTPGS